MKRNFWEVATYKQETAKTEQEAKDAFETTCSMCNRQASCVEKFCPLYKTHQLRLLVLESERDKHCVVMNVVKTRKYTKSSQKVNAKKAILNYLTRITKKVTSRKIQLVIDNASVQAELGELESCYWVLRHGGLGIVAEKVGEVIDKVKEVS